MRHRILVVAQDVMLRSMLARWLMSAGYIVELAESVRRAREVAANHKVALTLLAAGRSGGPALDLAETGGKLIVVAEQSQDGALLGSAVSPADGYLSAPLDEQKVLACVRSVLQPRPADEHEASRAPEIWSFDGFTIDLAGRSLRDGGGSEISLTRSEFALLVALARHPGRVLSRDQLLDAALGRRPEPYDRSIDVLIGRLRRKIEPDPKVPRFIVTVLGEGYKFTAKLHESRPPAQPAIGAPAADDAIMETVWPGRVVEEANLNVQISKLRHVLDQNREQGSWIQTLPGRGDRFVTPVTRPEADAPPDVSANDDVGSRPRLSIVVLPFANLSEDTQQQYFADGITEELTTELSRIKDMFVISRNTAFTYRNKAVDTKQIGRELGVRFVLEGSVRRSGSHVRVNAQLIDAEADAHVWAERFDRDLSDLFELQDEITTAIAGAIEPELLQFERNRVASQPQHSQDAYEFYQRGLWYYYRYVKEDSIEAQAYFRRALAIDPNYPQATAALAMALCYAAFLGWAEDAERNYVEAYELAERAVSLDDRYPAARFALGAACMWMRRSDRAIAEFQEAINLNPSYAAAHVLLGQMYLYRGRAEEAITLTERGIRLSPRDPRLFIWLSALAASHYQLRHYAGAIEAGRRSWTLNRNWPAGLFYVIVGLAQLGRIEEARAQLAELKLLIPNPAFVADSLQRLCNNRDPIDHVLDGLRKAGFE